MKCPECDEVSTFTHPYHLPYSAPIVLDHGEVAIDYDSATEHDPVEDEETCICDKCGIEVSLDNIEIVEMENGEAA